MNDHHRKIVDDDFLASFARLIKNGQIKLSYDDYVLNLEVLGQPNSDGTREVLAKTSASVHPKV